MFWRPVARLPQLRNEGTGMRFLDWIGLSHLSDRNARQIVDGINNSNSNGTESQELLTKKDQTDKACTGFDLLAYSSLFCLIQPAAAFALLLEPSIVFFEIVYIKVSIKSGFFGYLVTMIIYHATKFKYETKQHILLNLFFLVNGFGFLFALFTGTGINVRN